MEFQMQVSTTAVILDMDDKPIKSGSKELTTGEVMVVALVQTDQNEKDMSVKDKLDYFTLACKIRDAEKKGESVDLEFDDVKVIRERIAKFWGTLVIGRTFKYLQFSGEK